MIIITLLKQNKSAAILTVAWLLLGIILMLAFENPYQAGEVWYEGNDLVMSNGPVYWYEHLDLYLLIFVIPSLWFWLWKHKQWVKTTTKS